MTDSDRDTLEPHPIGAWLAGYVRSVAGETLAYHSPYPDATTALLVRATDGTMAIAWETAPVPGGFRHDSATFLWLAGLAAHKGAHRFDLLLEGTPLLSFRTARDASERTWRIVGAGGACLHFQATLVDQFDELFGVMGLTLPRTLLRPGAPLRLRVVGEAGGSSDWFMIFEHELSEWVRATGVPALVRGEPTARQLVRVEISHLDPPADVVAGLSGGGAGAGPSVGPTSNDEPALRARLSLGHNEIYLPVAAVDKEMELPISVTIGRRPAVTVPARLRPVAPRTLALLPHSHLDIGYSDPQQIVERKQWDYFEQAIEIARRTAGYPDGARFKWNVEQLWAVETYLEQASPRQRADFIAAVHNGWLSLQALLANVLSGICHPEELYHLTDCARRLARAWGVEIDTAMITDIPGQTWSLVPALAQRGVRYLSSGPNYMPGLPDGGDRIGGALAAWGDRPFWWVSPSGRERILLWMAGRGYSWFHGLNLGRLAPERDQRRAIFDYLSELEATAYPHDLVQVRYTIGGDNGPPDPMLPDFVRAWNEQYVWPRLRIATASELFAETARRHGAHLPQVRGDFTPYWEDGAASTARETAMNRASANRLLQAETVWAMRAPELYPDDEFYRAWRQIVLFSEHTWGAAESVSDPDCENSRRQWAYKRELALVADGQSRSLLERSLAAVRGDAVSPPGALDVLNTCSWERSEVVLVPPALSATGERVEDEYGRAVPSQRLTTGELAFLAAGVPGLAARRFRIVAGAPAAPSVTPAMAGDDGTLTNGLVRLAVEPNTGAVASLLWHDDGTNARRPVELVDRRGGLGLNEYLYVLGRDPTAATGAARASVAIGESGPLVASLVVEADAPGARRLARELRLCAGSDRLEIINRIDKLAVRKKESVHFAFPFRVPGGEVRLDLGLAMVRPGRDQIAGSCKDWFCVHNAVQIAGDGYGVTLVCLDAPLVEIGALTDETPVARGVRGWRSRIDPTQTVYSYAMNNYWHTNYKADQEGPVDLRYVVRPHRRVAFAETVTTGLAAARPLLVTRGAGVVSSPRPLLAVPHDVQAVVTTLRPGLDGRSVVFGIYNPSQRTKKFTLRGADGAPVDLRRCDRDAIPLAQKIHTLSLAPFERVLLCCAIDGAS